MNQSYANLSRMTPTPALPSCSLLAIMFLQSENFQELLRLYLDARLKLFQTALNSTANDQVIGNGLDVKCDVRVNKGWEGSNEISTSAGSKCLSVRNKLEAVLRIFKDTIITVGTLFGRQFLLHQDMISSINQLHQLLGKEEPETLKVSDPALLCKKINEILDLSSGESSGAKSNREAITLLPEAVLRSNVADWISAVAQIFANNVEVLSAIHSANELANIQRYLVHIASTDGADVWLRTCSDIINSSGKPFDIWLEMVGIIELALMT